MIYNIAAHAKAAYPTLVINNLRAFERVEGLTLENGIQGLVLRRIPKHPLLLSIANRKHQCNRHQ